MKDRNAEMRNKKIREFQMYELDILKRFVNVCQAEKLTYYVSGGTLLGAVRHKGFIPWDDDVDVLMPRPDYERFVQVAEKHFTKDFVLLRLGVPEWLTMDERAYFLKLENANMYAMGTNAKKTIRRNAYIDIFPLDGMPSNRIQNLLHRIRLFVLTNLYTIARFDLVVPQERLHRSWYNRLGVFVLNHIPLQRCLSIQKRWIALDRALKKYPYQASEYCINACAGCEGICHFRELLNKEILGDGAEYEFEDMKLVGAQDYDAYLKNLYGDYMTPPPESERNRHGLEFTE